MDTVLSATGISKSFPGVKALDNVDFDLREGEVMALMGENGAGKSTLMKILAGTYTRDSGSITVSGKSVDLGSRTAAEEAGISIVFQESSLLQHLTIAENLFQSDPPLNKFGFVDWKVMKKEGKILLDQLNVDLDPGLTTGLLSFTMQKMIEICRALSKDFKVLILDEPTAAITVEETEQLFRMIKQLQERGKSIIYISHRIREIKEICDRMTIFKDGQLVGSYDVADITEKEICEKMVGRQLLGFDYQSQVRDNVMLKVDNLSGHGFKNVSFELKEGEFLTVTGLTGAGRTELALTLFGEMAADNGTITVDGKVPRIRSARDAMKAGIGYVSEDRKKLGLFLDMNIAENMESNNIDTLTAGFLSQKKRIEEMADGNVDKFSIRCAGIKQPVKNLSGGNQQKVCLSRWTSYHPKILIVDEPTLGVDVGSKEEIYTILNQLTKEGMSIIMISSDMIETLSMGDRIMVMCEGAVMQINDRKKCTEEDIVALASGLILKDELHE